MTGSEPVVGDRVRVIAWDRPGRGAEPPIGHTGTVIEVFDYPTSLVWWGRVAIEGRGPGCPVRRDEIEKEDDK